jgi:N-acetylmuramoyl-L-alanine amidase
VAASGGTQATASLTIGVPAALAALWLAAIAAVPAAGEPVVSKARAWKHPTYTRLVLEISQRVDFHIFALTSPPRLVVDFPELDFALPPNPLGEKPVGAIAAMRMGLFEPGTSRMVIDLGHPALVRNAFLMPPSEGKPHRFVLDLEPAEEAAFVAEVRRSAPHPPAPPPVIQPPAAAVPPRPDGRHVIVIDPGHGGIDPGAIGASGVYEKEIALAAAGQLAARLRASGRYHVELTRDRDIFVSLRRRVAIAHRSGAELFLSLHADSMANTKVQGSHVYSLSKTASDAEAAALAVKENKSDIIAGLDLAAYSSEVGTILLDLSQRETNNTSAEIADRMVEEFRQSGIRALGRPHRQAGFAVLKAPDVPSVLIELGFLSNRTDEAMLTSARARTPLIDAIARAVDRYFETRTARRH